MFKKLDPLLHSELRLAVVSVLVNLEEADFVYLREATGATAGTRLPPARPYHYVQYYAIGR